MKTYSDKSHAMRMFLLAHRSEPVERMEKPGFYTQEHWVIQGQEIIFRIHVDGHWNAFIPCSSSSDPEVQVRDLHRFLEGARPDKDMIKDMTGLAQTFLDRLQDVPGCTSPDCNQASCAETRDLKTTIQNFLNRLNLKKDENVKS